MSIKVGFINDNYNLNNILNNTNSLILNSSTDSNIIVLNNDESSLSDTMINFKNKLITGLKDGSNYVIKYADSSNNLLLINNDTFIIDSKASFTNDISIGNIIQTSNRLLNVFGNTNIYLNDNDTDYFKIINNSNVNILTISSNIGLEYNLTSSNHFAVNNNSNTIFEITDSNIYVSNDMYIKNKKLYVNEITNYSGKSLYIENAIYKSSEIETLNATKSLTIINSNISQDITPFKIYKNLGNSNIIDIYTCNLNDITKTFSINKNGFVEIGNKDADASLSISKIHDNIIEYNGESIGDSYKLTKRGNIGIGISTPEAQLHIKRYDDLANSDIRVTPLMKLSMDYDATSNINNIISPIIYTTYTKDIIQLYNYQSVNQNNIINNFYLLNNDIYNTQLENNIINISNIIISSNIASFTNNLIVENLVDNISYNMTDKIIYPANFVIKYLGTVNNDALKIYTSSFLMMTKDTDNNGGYNDDITDVKYNSSNFENATLFNSSVYTVPNIIDIKYIINFTIETKTYINDNLYNIPYQDTYNSISRVLVPPPNFMLITSNNKFISSISPYGTLSLGTEVPSSNKNYLLYATGNGLINTIQTDTITPITGNNISYNNSNIININYLKSNSNNINNAYIYNSIIENCTNKQLYCSNLNFNTMSSPFMSCSNNKVHINTFLSVGSNNINDITNITMMRISVDSNIIPVSTSSTLGTIFYERHNGLLIENDTTNSVIKNPCLTIQGNNDTIIPYFNINNTNASYLFRLKKERFNSDSTTDTNIFELCCDNVRYTHHGGMIYDRGFYYDNIKNPHIMQHIKNYNILTFGENNNVCVDCLNKKSITGTYNYKNSDNKISIGVPYKILDIEGVTLSDYPKYFNDVINIESNPYMMNIYGNIKIASITNKNAFVIKTDDTTDEVYSAINGDPDNLNNLYVDGSVKCSNLNIVTDISMNINDAENNPYTSLISYIRSLETRIKALEPVVP